MRNLLTIAAAAACAFTQLGCQPECGDGPHEALCSDLCVDLESDNLNCGACGVVCGAGTACTAGGCRTTCTAGLTACGASCVDVTTDENDCGSCGTRCAADQLCDSGLCHSKCEAGRIFCGDSCVDPQTDEKHCGASGHCSVTDKTQGTTCSALEYCSQGSCRIGCAGGTTCGSGEACTSNATCASDEVCAASKCRRAFGTSFTIGLALTVAPTEPDGTAWDSDGTAPDPYANLLITTATGDLIEFPIQASTYQPSWTHAGYDFSGIIGYHGDGSFQISVMDSDWDLIAYDGICNGGFPGSVIQALHSGSVTMSVGSCTSATLTFTPEAPPE